MNNKKHKVLASATVMSLLLSTVATVTPVKAAEVNRLSGETRETTAVDVAKKVFGKAEAVIIVNGYGYADAVSATPLAKQLGAPILLTNSNGTSIDVQALKDLGAKKVIIIGGTGAVSSALAAQLDKEYQVERIQGQNRYETNANVAKEVLKLTGKKEAILVSAEGYADALSVASIAAAKGVPVLFANSKEVPAAVKAVADGLTIKAVGGTGVLPEGVLATVSAERITKNAKDRFQTNLEVLEYYKNELAGVKKVYMAAGGQGGSNNQFADALVASAAAAKDGAPVVLTGLGANATQKTAANEYVVGRMDKDTTVSVVGGVASVAVDDVKAVEDKKEELNKVVEVKVEGVSAVNAKTLKVEFNTAVDTEKATIEVKRDTVKPSVKEVKFSEDKKSATVEFNANMLAGDYTVTVTGLSEKALTGSVKVEAEKLTAIEFLSDVAVINANDIKMSVQAKNQYGEIINDKLATTNTNISVTASKGTTGHAIDKDGLLTVKGNAGDFKADDKVVVTIVDSATGVTATKTVTVAKAAQVESIQLGELKTDDEELAKKPVNVANMGADFAKYYIPVTIKDQYGNTLKAADLAGVNVLSSNEKIVKVASTQIVDITKVGTVIKLQAPDATATHGTAVLTVVSAGTGKTASVSVKVLENAKTDVLTVSTPETALKIDVKTELPFTAADQYGNPLVASSELGYTSGNGTTKLTFADGSTLTATGANLDYSVDYGNKNKVKLHVTPTAKNVVLTAVSATGKAQTLNLTAEAKPEVASLGGLSKDVYKAIQKDQEQTIKIADVIVKDQYGEDITLPAGYDLTFTAVDGALDTVTLNNTTLNTGTASTTAKAAVKGIEGISISLVDTTNTKTLDTITVNFETVELKDITEFGIKEIGKLYSGTAESLKYGNATSDYDKAIKIFGKKGSTEVFVDQALLVSTTATAPIVVNGATITQASNQVVTKGEDKTATLTGVIAGANDPITVTQTVTYSDAQSVIKELQVRKPTGDKSEIKDGAVVVPVASIGGKKIGPVGADSTFQFYAKDQYGVEAKELSYTVTNLKSTNATKVEIVNDGTITVTGTLAAGDTFTITAIVDGVVKSVKVIVGA